MAKYSSLPTVMLNAGSGFTHVHEPKEIAHMNDPAQDVLTDFNHRTAITIAPGATLAEAEMEMRVCGTHLLIVIDKEEHVIGMISSEDILGSRPMRVMQERRIHRDEVTVRMVMTPQAKIPVIRVEELRHAKVGDVIKTLHELKQHHAFVVEINEISGDQVVSGLFSLWQISRQLGHDVTYDVSEAHSLAELQHDFDKP